MYATAATSSRGLDPGWTARHDPLAAARRMRADPGYRRQVLEAFAHSARGPRHQLIRSWSQAVRETRDPAARAELGEELANLRRVPRVELRFLRLRGLDDGAFHAARRRHDLRLWLHHRPPGGARGVLLSGPGPALAAFERELGAGVEGEVPTRRLAIALDYAWAPDLGGKASSHRLELELEGWEAAEVAEAVQRDAAAFVAARIRAGASPGYRWGVVTRVRWAVTRGLGGETLACGACCQPLPLD